MRQSSPALALAALAALGGLSLSPGVARSEGERTRKVEGHGDSLTVPEGWEWEDVSAVDQEKGFFLLAKRKVKTGIEASARVRVVDAGGAGVESLLSQIADAKTKDLKDPTYDQNDLEWGGHAGRVLKGSGTYENGAKVYFEVYGAIVGGKFHQLDIRAVNGAEEKVREEIDSIVTAFLLPGGKSGGKSADGSDAGPPSMRFPNIACTWTLPAPKAKKEGEEPVRWAFGNQGKADRKKGEDGLLAFAGLIPPDGGGNPVTIEFAIHPEREGFTAEGIINHEPNFEKMVESNFADNPAPRVDTDTTWGNLPAASRLWVGKDKDEPKRQKYIKVYMAVLQGALYQGIVVAHEKAEHDYHEQIVDAIAGIKWDDVKTGTRGPWLTPFTSYTDVRKESIGVNKETTETTGAFILKKPAIFAKLKYNAAESGYASWAFAAEARKGPAYAFVGIEKFAVKAFVDAKPVLAPESKIDDRETDWKNKMEDPKTLQKGGKTNKKPDTFQSAKGFSYEFSGRIQSVDVLEHGWLVKEGQDVFMIHVQYCGKDAKAALEGDVKALLKSLKFN